MVKKKEQKVFLKTDDFPQELKKYRTSDGMEFESLQAASEHEEDLKNPYYIMYRDKARELQEANRKLTEKQEEIDLLNKRIEEMQKDLLRGSENRFPTQLPQDPYRNPCPTFPNPADPSQQPYRWNCGCKPKPLYA